MNKIIFLFSLIILGCSAPKKNSFFCGEYRSTLLSDSLNLKFYSAEAVGHFGWKKTSKEELVEFLIKNIAKRTIKKGKKYFFIIFPKEVSNYEGRIINTIEGFKENINYVRSTNKFKCPKKPQCPPLTIEVTFVMLDEKSMDYVVWDAKKILAN